MPFASQQLPAGDAPTEPGTPANLEARQILERAQAQLFGDVDRTAGRYEIVRKLGAGGMGVVYEAYDPLLDCRVALKQLRPELAAERGFLDRLRREARAMAKLRAEPRVVTLYDFFVHHDIVFVVMEFVEGTTLRAWQEEAARAWPAVVDKYVQAGLGLAAAHAAGLVHRDFKPENVMVSPNGRVRVMDFGLVRVEGPGAATLSEVGDADPLALELTEGTLLGTPRYMSPEQWEGGPVDARSDQFSFCVALWEAVHGAPPFAGATPPALARAVKQGQLQSPPPGASVPRWLHRVLARGLSTAPEQRFPTMAALCAALERERGRVRTRRMLAGLGALALAGAGAAGWQQHARAQQIVACEQAGAAIATEWDDAARDRLRAALVTSGVGYAATTFERVVPWVERWTAEWSRIRSDACRAAEVEETLPPELYARTTACLDERRGELSALLDVLAEGGATTVARAVPAVAALPELVACTDRATLERRAVLPGDPEIRDRVVALRRDLARVAGLERAGRFADALQSAESALAAAEAVAYPPVLVTARLWVGLVASRAGQFDAAEAALTRTFVDAAVLGEDETATRAVVGLVFVAGHGRGRPVEGILWSRTAEVFVRRLGHAERPLGAMLQTYLAAVHRAGGDRDSARAALLRALALQERLLGPDHPDVAGTLSNLALLDDDRGAYDEARSRYERALAIQERALGPEHPHFARTLNNLAGVRRYQGAYDEARAMYQRVLAIREAILPPEHPDIAGALSNLALIEDDRRAYPEARRLYERAQAILVRSRDPDHPDLALLRSNLASVLEKLDERAQARELYAQALAAWEKTLGPEHVALTAALVGLGRLARVDGRAADAVSLLERAVRLRTPDAVPPQFVAEARFELARALRALPDAAHAERAERLAIEAAEGFRAAGPGFAEQLGEVEAWQRGLAR